MVRFTAEGAARQAIALGAGMLLGIAATAVLVWRVAAAPAGDRSIATGSTAAPTGGPGAGAAQGSPRPSGSASAKPSAATGPPAPEEPVSRCTLVPIGGDAHDTDRGTYLNPIGTKRAVMIFVDFPNVPAASAPTGYRSTDAYSRFFIPDGPDWFAASSFGRFTLKITPVDRWLRMSKDDTAYHFQRDLSFKGHQAYVAEAVRLADPFVDFSAYDLVYVVPPINAAGITFSPTFAGGQSSTIVADGKRVGLAVTFGQDMWLWGPKVLNHETGHTMGLPDLYEFNPPDGNVHPYVAGWDLMGNIGGSQPDYFAWHKWKNGWIDDAQVRCVSRPGTTATTLTPVETAGGVKLLLISVSNNRVYAVEKRRAVGNDAGACSSGVLIYLVDGAGSTGHGPIRVVDASPRGSTRPDCEDLDTATYKVGGAYTNRAAHLTIKVTAQTGDKSTVQVTVSG
jgi:M6 family metalloprotease-like protein